MDAPGNLPVQAAQAKVGMGYRRAGFTLVELLITVSVIAIMATMVLFALFAAQETAREQKTKALIAKLDSIIKAKYETYKTRRVPITLPPGTMPPLAAKMRLDSLRDLMRLEMPDRWTDVVDDPVAPFELSQKIARPSVSAGYLRRKNAGTSTDEYQGAECLYLIVMHAQQEDADDKSVFKPDQIKDTDGDGFPELVDAWGTPIRFLRWCPGFVSDLNKPAEHDPFDPRQVYPNTAHPEPNFAIYPLVYSAGPDKCFGIVSELGTTLRYVNQNLNPCFVPGGAGQMIGTPFDAPAEPNFVVRGWVDNIHNHMITAR